MILLTFFDESYLAQGQVMLRSFMQHTSKRFKICVLWLGDKPGISGDHNIEVVNLQQFISGDERLFEARKNRSYRSFCWTLEPALVHSCLKAQSDGEIIVYCDADVMWFADPVPTILSVMENADVALSPHRFPVGQEHHYRSVGKYNFGCGIFRACDLTRRIVGEWLDQTLEKCDEFGAGDQKYLDEWPEKMGDRLAELHPGFNVGPWSLPKCEQVGEKIVCEMGGWNTRGWKQYPEHPEITTPLISMHFHEMRRGIGPNPVTLKGEQWNRTFYSINPLTIESVYKKYESELEKFLP